MQTLVINVITPILYYKTVALFGLRKALRLFNLWVPTGPGRGTNLRASREAASEVRGMRLAANRHHATTYSCTVWVPKHTGRTEHACDNAVGIGPIPARLWYITRIRHGAIITLLPHHSVFNRRFHSLIHPHYIHWSENIINIMLKKRHLHRTLSKWQVLIQLVARISSTLHFHFIVYMCFYRWFRARQSCAKPSICAACKSTTWPSLLQPSTHNNTITSLFIILTNKFLETTVVCPS